MPKISQIVGAMSKVEINSLDWKFLQFGYFNKTLSRWRLPEQQLQINSKTIFRVAKEQSVDYVC